MVAARRMHGMPASIIGRRGLAVEDLLYEL
jgi:hypothetical protein